MQGVEACSVAKFDGSRWSAIGRFLAELSDGGRGLWFVVGLGLGFGKERKGERRLRRGFYRSRSLREGVGYRARGAGSTAQRAVVLLQVSWMEVEEDLIGGVHLSAGVRGAADTPSGKAEMGRGWLSGLGRMAPPRPFSIFFISFSFLF
jgi:hypothetical protein